jgi:hypothetical protein
MLIFLEERPMTDDEAYALLDLIEAEEAEMIALVGEVETE